MSAATPLEPQLLDSTAPLAVRRRQLDEVRARLLKQAADAAAVQQPNGQMVGNIFVPPSIFQQLSAALRQADIGGYFAKQRLDKAEAQYANDEQAAAAEIIKRLRGKELPGPVQDQPQIDFSKPQDQQTPPAVLTRPLTDNERLQVYQEGMAVPSLRGALSKAFDDQLIQAPIRAEKAAEAQAALKQKAADRLEELRVKLEDRALDRASREAMQRESFALRQQLAQQGFDLRRDLASQAAAARVAQAASVDKVQARQEAQEQRKLDAAKQKDLQGLNQTDFLLNQAEPLLSQATSSGVGSLVDTGLGALGYSLKGADAAAKLKVIAGNIISSLPRAPGAQSDFELKQLEAMMGRLGDSTVPLDQKQAALNQVRAIVAQKRRALSDGPTLSPSGSVTTPPTWEQQYDQLPRGAQYIGPDGKTRIKR